MKVLTERWAGLLGLWAWLAACGALGADIYPMEQIVKGPRSSPPAATEATFDPSVPGEPGPEDEVGPSRRSVLRWFRGATGGECHDRDACGFDCPAGADGTCDSGCGCGGVDVTRSGADECSRIGLELFAGVEAFRSVADGSFPSNAGGVIGGNLGIPMLRNLGIGAQFGASFSLNDLDGRVSGVTALPASQTQEDIFITVGIFRRATENIPVNVGLASDLMITSGYGEFASSPTMSQFRYQLGYDLSDRNEIGTWGTIAGQRSYRSNALLGDLTFRPIGQYDLFWHHNFDAGADSWLWFGVLEKEDVTSAGGQLGEFTAGITLQVPLTERTAIYATGQYMRPSATPAAGAAIEDAYSIGFGVVFFPRGQSRTHTVAGERWMPYLPVANHSNFLVDTTAF